MSCMIAARKYKYQLIESLCKSMVEWFQGRATHRHLPKEGDFYESPWNGSIGYSQAYS